MEASELMMRFRTEGEEGAIRALHQVDSGIQSVDRNAKSAGGGLRGMFNMAGAFATGQALLQLGSSVFHIGSGFIMANANAEQAKLSLETVTGSASKANAVFQEIQKFAAATPFEFPELIQASINLESFGMKTMDWLPTIGDTAAAMGKSVDVVVQAVLDASTGEYERLKELGIKAAIEGDQVKFRYMKNGQEIVETVDKNNQSLINSTIMGIWNSKYDGAMEKQSQSFLGRWSTLKDNINIKMQEMSSGVFGFASTALGFMNDIFANGFLATVRGTFGTGVSEFLGNVGSMVGGIIEAFGEGRPVSEIVKGLPASWQPFAETLGDLSDSIGDIVSAFQSGGWSAAFKELWDDIKIMAGDGIDIGKIVLKGTFSLASNVGGNLLDWVKGQLWHGGDPMLAGLPVGDLEDIGLGDVIVQASLIAGGQLASWAGHVYDWIKAQLFSGGDPMLAGLPVGNGLEPINIGDVLVAGAIALAGDLNDIAGAIDRELKLQVTDAQLAAANASGQSAGKAFADAVSAGFQAATKDAGGDGSGGATGKDGGIWSDLKRLLKWEPSIFRDDEPTWIDASFAWAQGFGIGLRNKVINGIKSAFEAPTAFIPGMGGGMVTTGDSPIRRAWDALKADLLNPDVTGWTPPDFPDWLTNPSEWFSPVINLIDKLNKAADDLQAAWNKLQFWKDKSSGGESGPSPFDPSGANTSTSNGVTTVSPQWGKTPLSGDFMNVSSDNLMTVGSGGYADMIAGLQSAGNELQAFTTTWHTALSNAGADIAAFAASKSAFPDIAQTAFDSANRVDSAFASLPARLADHGRNAADSFAAALWAGVAEATAAATAIAAAVDIAVAARLKIHSPSVVMDQHGINTTMPFLNRLRWASGEAGRIFNGMALPGSGGSFAMSAAGSSGGGVVINNHNYIMKGPIGRGAQTEVQRMVATGQAKAIKSNDRSRSLAGARQ